MTSRHRKLALHSDMFPGKVVHQVHNVRSVAINFWTEEKLRIVDSVRMLELKSSAVVKKLTMRKKAFTEIAFIQSLLYLLEFVPKEKRKESGSNVNATGHGGAGWCFHSFIFVFLVDVKSKCSRQYRVECRLCNPLDMAVSENGDLVGPADGGVSLCGMTTKRNCKGFQLIYAE